MKHDVLVRWTRELHWKSPLVRLVKNFLAIDRVIFGVSRDVARCKLCLGSSR